jgi:undecaprenyl diphosphate synthase
MFNFKSLISSPDIAIDQAKLPQHIAIIMDGNGRWAQKRGLPRTAGHIKGVDALKEVVKTSAAIGLKYLSVYAFSTENWKRPKDEVDFLMSLLTKTINKELTEIIGQNVKVNVFGRTNELPEGLQKSIDFVRMKSAGNTGLTLNIMLNYGSRAEIADGVRQLAKQIELGRLKPEDITEERITQSLYTAPVPDPDLLIRTSGEMRLSNFLLWQAAYAEIYVTQALWPDFGRIELLKAIKDYQERQRRFGGI